MSLEYVHDGVSSAVKTKYGKICTTQNTTMTREIFNPVTNRFTSKNKTESFYQVHTLPKTFLTKAGSGNAILLVLDCDTFVSSVPAQISGRIILR
jgi:hypothetical protein